MRITSHIASALAAAIVWALLATPVAAQPNDGEEPPSNGDKNKSDAPADTKTAATDDTDIEALRKEYRRLRDLLFRSRARAAAVASALFSSKILVHLDYTSGRFYSIKRATIRLDNATLYDDSDGAVAKNKAPRFNGYVAPGRHKLTFRIEAIGKDDNRFVSTVETSVIVIAPAGSDLIIKATAKDAGNIPYTWKKKKRGSYKLHIDIEVKSVARAVPGAKRKRGRK